MRPDQSTADAPGPFAIPFMTLTLDTNCIIDVEMGEGAAAEVRRLLSKHEAGQVDVQVAGIVASERLRSGGYAPSFSEFSGRIAALARRSIRVLKPIGRWDVTYWDEGLWADDVMTALEEEIHSVLFSQPYAWADVARQDGIDALVVRDETSPNWRKWRNRLCDTAAMWCHIYYGGDIFVTRDANFLEPTKRAALEHLGAKSIADPLAACTLVGA